MTQLFLIAFRNLVQNKKRTLLLGGAIAGVTTLMVFLLCLSTGLRATMLESATTVMTGHINIAGFYKVTAGQSAPLVTQYEKVKKIAQEALPDIDYMVVRGRGFARIVSETASMQYAIGGIRIHEEPKFSHVVHLTAGNFDDLAQPNTILLFEEQAKKLDVRVGDMLVISVLTPRGVNNTIDVRVVAIAQDMGLLSSFNVFISDDSLHKLYQLNDDSVGAIQIYLKDMKHIPQDLDLLRKSLTANGYVLMDPESKPFWQKFDSVNREEWTGQKIDLTTWEDELAFIKWSITAIDGLMYTLTTILLIIISIGIMNSMWITIRERTREIGTLRAIGMQRLRVLSMFVIEAFTLSGISTIAGTILGLLIAGGMNLLKIHVPHSVQLFLMSNTVHLVANPSRIMTGMLVITGCTTLISLIPSTHAARMKPITAIQHIG